MVDVRVFWQEDIHKWMRMIMTMMMMMKWSWSKKSKYDKRCKSKRRMWSLQVSIATFASTLHSLNFRTCTTCFFHAQVSFKSICACKCLFATQACIWFGSCVYTNMSLKIMLTLECTRTHWACKRSRIIMTYIVGCCSWCGISSSCSSQSRSGRLVTSQVMGKALGIINRWLWRRIWSIE